MNSGSHRQTVATIDSGKHQRTVAPTATDSRKQLQMVADYGSTPAFNTPESERNGKTH